MNVLTEAVGTPTYVSIIDKMHEVGWKIIATDIVSDAIGLSFADEGYIVPRGVGGDYFDVMEEICRKEEVDLVVPSLDEALVGWAARRKHFERKGVKVLISNPEIVASCCDKKKTALFFLSVGVPTPATIFPSRGHMDGIVIKERRGRGAKGTKIIKNGFTKEGKQIIQEFIEGQEYTVDVLCDLNGKIVRLVVRERLFVIDGKSFRGTVVRDDLCKNSIKKIIDGMGFIGPINIQYIRRGESIFFIEVNPRISGGLPLSMEATDNWFGLIDRMYKGEKISRCEPRIGTTMIRYWKEHFK